MTAPRYAAPWIIRRLEGLRERLTRPAWVNYVMGGRPPMFGDDSRLQTCPRCGRLDATLIVPGGPAWPKTMRCRVCHREEDRS